MKKAFYGWDKAVTDVVDISRLEHVLDIAAGTCIWTLDFASIPEVKARLRVQDDAKDVSPIHLYACDIETKFFPEKQVTDEAGITTFQQDITKSFAEDMLGRFDLVHASFLCVCLTKDGWRKALENCYKLLSASFGVYMLNSMLIRTKPIHRTWRPAYNR